MKSDQFYGLFPRADVKYFVEDENNNVLFKLGKDNYDDVGEPAFWEDREGVKKLGLNPEDFKLWNENPLKFLHLYKEKHYFHKSKKDDNVDLAVIETKFWDPLEWSYNDGKVEDIKLKMENVDFENFRIYVGEDKFFMLKNKLEILNFGEVDEINFEDNKNVYCLGLKVMYILSYIGGMSMDNLRSENNLAKSLAYFYFYYHLNKFYNYRNFLQYNVSPLEKVELFKSLYTWSQHKVHFYPHMKMGDDEFKKNKHDVIANVRKMGKWVTWQERGKKRYMKEDYKKLILFMGKGLTKTGQLLFQESCQAYVYCVLGSQAKTRWKIIGDGANSLQTQRVFLTLVDEVIKENNLSMLIKSMRLAIKQTNVRLDFVISPGLELIPSEMIFIKDSPGYNNVLLISNETMKFGSNSSVNNIEKSLVVKNEEKQVEKKEVVKKVVNHPKEGHILTTSLITAFVLRFIWLAL